MRTIIHFTLVLKAGKQVGSHSEATLKELQDGQAVQNTQRYYKTTCFSLLKTKALEKCHLSAGQVSLIAKGQSNAGVVEQQNDERSTMSKSKYSPKST